MDPRTFLAPIQCNLCNLLLYTLRDVSQHCAQHDVIDFICHHCLTHFDSKGAISAHMNQKGAHLRQSFNLGTYTSAMPSPAPSTTAVLPISHPTSQPTPTLSGSSPTPTVAISDNVSLDQLLRDIDAPNTFTDTSASSAGVLPPFQHSGCLDAATFIWVAGRIAYCWGMPEKFNIASPRGIPAIAPTTYRTKILALVVFTPP